MPCWTPRWPPHSPPVGPPKQARAFPKSQEPPQTVRDPSKLAGPPRNKLGPPQTVKDLLPTLLQGGIHAGFNLPLLSLYLECFISGDNLTPPRGKMTPVVSALLWGGLRNFPRLFLLHSNMRPLHCPIWGRSPVFWCVSSGLCPLGISSPFSRD